MHQAWLEISKSALLNNIFEIKKNLPRQTKFMAVVKANAYGHGLLEVISVIKDNVDGIASFHLEDLILLRRKKITKPLLCLGNLLPEQIDLAIKNNIEVTISTLDVLQRLQKKSGKKKLKVHICVDSGLGRDGFVEDDLEKVVATLQNKNLQKNLDVVGMYTHFAAADDSKFDSYTKSQIEILKIWQKSLIEIGLAPQVHASASAATLREKAVDFDFARVGLSLYGLWPSEQIKKQRQGKNKLRPVLSWRVKIAEVKNMKKGSAISYGCTHILKRDSKIAVLPIGYFDGVSRVSSNCGFVLVKGKKAPQLGRVTMNLIVLDVTDVVGAKAGDVVTILGRDKKSEITADDWASWSQTSNYEIVTRLNSFLPRIIVK